MTKCPQCGRDVSFFERDLFTGVCATCRRVGARPATLGCGTLIIIAIIVAMFSQSGANDVERRLRNMEQSIESLSQQMSQQSTDIRALRAEIDSLRRGLPARTR